MSSVTLKLAKLSIRERLALVEKRFNSMASKVYADNLSKKEESIHHLLYNLISYYQNLLSYEEWLAYSLGC